MDMKWEGFTFGAQLWKDVTGQISYLLMALLIILLVPGASSPVQATPVNTTDMIYQPDRAGILQAYASMPILFIANQGQVDSQVAYYAKAPGQTVYLTSSGMVFDLVRYQETGRADVADRQSERLAFRLEFVDANASPLIQGGDKDQAVVNYLIGNDPQKWHTSISTYRDVIYKDVYPGIDLRLYGKDNSLEYEFVVQPGANISDIAMAYTGVAGLDIDSGELMVSTAFGDLAQSRPYIYQQVDGDTIQVDGGFKLLGFDSYGFEIGSYDAGYPLVIDPSLSLSYSTYLGGIGNDSGKGIAVESGYAYVTGSTDSTDFPTQNYYQTGRGTFDAFVSKIDTTRSGAASLIYSTYLGGTGADLGSAIAVESGCAYVTGQTYSSNFPIWNQYQTDNTTCDVFVTRLNTIGDNITYSTYLGGTGVDNGNGIAVESGCAYVTGDTSSTNFPIKNQYQSDNTSNDAFVTKLDTAQAGASSLIYSTYLGGNGDDKGFGIAVESGCAYITGQTGSTDFPIKNQYQSDNTSNDAFVTKLDTAQSGASSLIYSTYLGGDGSDISYAIAVESGCAYVIGQTSSTNFPTLHAYQTGLLSWNAFVTRFNTTGDGLVYSTYLGGGLTDEGRGIAVESGCAYVTGKTDSADFPISNQYQTDNTSWDAFVTKLDTTLSDSASLIYSTYLGGDGDDTGYGIAVESGYAYVTGQTSSTDFPTLNQYQADQTDEDAFITKLSFATITVTSPDGGESWASGSSQAVTWASSCVSDNVDILISRNGGGSYTVLINDTLNDGSEMWTVTGPATIQARIAVQGHDDQGVNDASDADFTITCTKPGAPNLSSPADDDRVSGTSVTLQWIKGTGTPTDYQLKVNSSAGMDGTSYFDGSVGNVLSKVVNGLPNNGSTIYWTVGASNACGYSPWATMRSFTNSPNCAGDYNGDNRTEIASYLNGTWYIDYNGNGAWNKVAGGDSQCFFGDSSMKPVTGDWDNDGITEIGTYVNGTWYIDYNGNGVWNNVAGGDRLYSFGDGSMKPLTGDWDNDGTTEIGTYVNGTWYIDYNGNGAWNRVTGGDRQYSFGDSSMKPVTGDWNGDGITEIGTFVNGTWYIDYNGNGAWNRVTGGDRQYSFGDASQTPVGNAAY